jgi:hypothetical protein
VSAPHEKREELGEIEITPEMIAAGVQALIRYDHELFDARASSEAERLAVEVFEAMVAARQCKIG